MTTSCEKTSPHILYFICFLGAHVLIWMEQTCRIVYKQWCPIKSYTSNLHLLESPWYNSFCKKNSQKVALIVLIGGFSTLCVFSKYLVMQGGIFRSCNIFAVARIYASLKSRLLHSIVWDGFLYLDRLWRTL